MEKPNYRYSKHDDCTLSQNFWSDTMSTYNTVLIAIDLHGSPEQVLARAAELIDKKSAKSTHILTASPGPAFIYSTYPAYSGTTPTLDWEQVHEDRVKQIVSLAEEAGLTKANIIEKNGRAIDVILEEAQRLEADLVIVGSHGRHGVGLLLGSTANGVLHRAKCDVLAVRIAKEAIE
jgi:universal stress protein A